MRGEPQMGEPVIIDAVRSPVGRRKGFLRETRPDTLYAHVLDTLLDRTGLEADRVEDVVTGCVTQAGEQGANIGRLAVLLSRLPATVPATTLDRMCGSGQQAVHFAAQAVAAGDMSYAVGGGVEVMTRVPMFSGIGGIENLNPALFQKYELIHQGESAERVAERYSLSREILDEFGYHSHRRAAQAAEAGYFQSQLAPIQGVDADGNPATFNRDEGVRPDADLQKMADLPTPFRKDGAITAGNSSQISDGAGALLVADRKTAEADGFRTRARFLSRVVVGADPTLQLLGVIPATRLALQRAGLAMEDIDVVEINEAFAAVVLAWAKEVLPGTQPNAAEDLNTLYPKHVNPNGGAIAHGHPLGATGAVLMTKLLNELERRGARYGLQTMCIGHGMATASVIEVT